MNANDTYVQVLYKSQKSEVKNELAGEKKNKIQELLLHHLDQMEVRMLQFGEVHFLYQLPELSTGPKSLECALFHFVENVFLRGKK